MNWLQGKDENREGLTLGEEFCEFNSNNKPPFQRNSEINGTKACRSKKSVCKSSKFIRKESVKI